VEERLPLYETLIFVCTNNRGTDPGVRPSCGVHGSEELRLALKRAVKEHGAGERVRVHSSGCMEGCEFGPNILVFPDNVMYSGVCAADLPVIVAAHVAPLGTAAETNGEGPPVLIPPPPESVEP